MSSREMKIPYLTCAACKNKSRPGVRLTPCKIDDMTAFICSTEKCLYPLNSRKLHKYVFKQDSPGSELKMCDASEVPNLKHIFEILMKKNRSMIRSKPEKLPEKLPGSKETSSAFVLSANIDPVNQGTFFAGEGAQEQIEVKTVFPILENKDAFCWLHSTLCLLVHSKNLKHYFKYEDIGDCHLKEISMAYDKAVLTINSENLNKWSMRSSIPVSNLEKLREKAFNYLQPLMRCERGQEESPVFAILLLLRENKNLHSLFLSKFALELKCDNCGYKKISQNTKCLISIIGTVLNFNEANLTYTFTCIQCNSSGQKISLQFFHMPPLLLMHFVNGLPSNNIASFDFHHDGQMYAVKGFLQYKRSSRHFVSWIRSDEGNQWMCCDDLKSPLQQYTTQLPAVPASEIHIILWEHRATNNSTKLTIPRVINSDGDSHEICVSESTSPPLITLEDSDYEDHQPFYGSTESSSASQKSDVCDNTSSITPCPKVLSHADSHSDYLTDKGSIPFGYSCDASGRNIEEELSSFQRKERKLSSKEVFSSIDGSHILGKEDSTESNYMSKSVAGCIGNLPIQKTTMVTHNTVPVPSSSESLSISADNVQFQNTREEVLQPSNNFKSKSVLEKGLKAVAEVKVSSADEKFESIICDVTSDSKNEAGVEKSKHLGSPVGFESVAHAVEECIDNETNANGKLNRGENVGDSLSPAVEDMSRSNHETSKIDKTKIASQHSEHSDATSFFGSIPKCYVIADKSKVETYAEKHYCEKRNANKEDRCSQSSTSPKISSKAQNHDDSGKATFPVEKNDVETASSGRLKISIGVCMSPSAHNMTFRRTPRKSASTRSPSTEQTEASVASSPVSGHVSCIEEPKTGTNVDTVKVFIRRIKRYESEHKSTGENAVKTDSNIPVTSDTFISNVTAIDNDLAHSVKEKASVHPEAVLNDSSHTTLDNLAADFEMKNILNDLISPVSSVSLFTAPSADDSAFSGNTANTSIAVIQHAEDLKMQQPNNLDIPSVQDVGIELQTDFLKEMCRNTVSSITDLEENKDNTQLCGSDLQKTPKSGDGSNTTLMEALSNILALRKLCQATDQNLAVSFNDTASNDEDINGHTAANGGPSFCSWELASRKHSTLNKKKPCAKVIGQRKTFENVVTIPEQVAMNENETSRLKKISMENKPDEVLEPDNDVLLGSCFQSKPVVDDSRHLQNPMQEESIHYNVADFVCKQKVKQKCEPDSVKFKNVPVDTQPSVPECHVKDGVNKANNDRSCSDYTNLKSNEMHLRVTEANSPKPSSGGTDTMESKVSALSISTAKTCAKSKALALKTSKVSPNAKENMLTFENIIAVFHHNTEDVVSEHANKVSKVPCPVGKSKRGVKKKQEKDNSFTQVCLSTSSLDLKKLNLPVTPAQRRASQRPKKQTNCTYCSEVAVARSKVLYIGIEAHEHNACPGVLNESQKSGSAPEKDLGVVENCLESNTISRSASPDSTSKSKSHGKKRKCSKDKIKSPSVLENSSESGTAEGMSEKKKRKKIKSVHFKSESKSSHCFNEQMKAACSSSRKINQTDILEDKNAAKGKAQRDRKEVQHNACPRVLNESLKSGNASPEKDLGVVDNRLESKTVSRSASRDSTTGSKSRGKTRKRSIKKKSSASILGAQKKGQSNKHLSSIEKKATGASRAEVKSTTLEAQPSTPLSAVAHDENQSAASNIDISSSETSPFLLYVPLQYLQQYWSPSFQFYVSVPYVNLTRAPGDEFSTGLNNR